MQGIFRNFHRSFVIEVRVSIIKAYFDFGWSLVCFDSSTRHVAQIHLRAQMVWVEETKLEKNGLQLENWNENGSNQIYSVNWVI